MEFTVRLYYVLLYLQVDCQTLEVPYDCDEAQVRSSYIRLAKKFHPDSGSQEACKDKFNEV